MAISERLRNILGIEALEQLLVTIVESTQDAVVLVDEDNKMVVFNRGAEDLFKYRATEALEQDLNILLPHNVRVGNAERRVELNGICKDGSHVPLEVTLSRVEFNGHGFVSAVIRDLTERKQFESSLAEAEAELQSYREQVKQQFIEEIAAIQSLTLADL